MSLTFLFLYILFSRYACKVELFEDRVTFKYFFFWDKNISIPFEKVNTVDYEKSFYDFIDDKTIGGLYSFPKYCYDKIVFKTQAEEVEVLVNTRIFTFNKLFSLIENRISAVFPGPGVP